MSGPSRMNATAVCSPTPVAPGFVLWTPRIPSKDVHHKDRSSSSRSNTSSTSSSSSTGTSSVLVLMFTWLFCTPRAAARYMDLYTHRGWHVLHVSSQLMHFLWPPRSQSFALDIAQVLRERCEHYSHIVVHALSIGAYNYTTCLMLASEQPDLQTYLFSKLRAVVFDSLTLGTLDNMVQGIATGVSQWRVVQTTTRSLASLYLFLTRKTTVQAFNQGVEFFRTHPALVPTLVFSSEDDPICDVEALRSMLHDWSGRPELPLSFKVWERSHHCGHLLHHSEDYQQLLNQFLLSVRFVDVCEGGEAQGEAKRLISKL